jgi:hypothetical protein
MVDIDLIHEYRFLMHARREAADRFAAHFPLHGEDPELRHRSPKTRTAPDDIGGCCM